MEDEKISQIRKMLDKSEYIKELGIVVTEISGGRATGKVPLDKKHLNPGGTMHGGCLYSLADTVAGSLAYSMGADVVTVEGGLHFLEAAKDTEWVYCEAIVKRAGKCLVVVDVELKDDNKKLLDCGTFTYFRMDPKEEQDIS